MLTSLRQKWKDAKTLRENSELVIDKFKETHFSKLTEYIEIYEDFKNEGFQFEFEDDWTNLDINQKI